MTYWAFLKQVQADAHWCCCCQKTQQPGHCCCCCCCEEKTPCGDIVWVAGRTGRLPQIITSEINLMCGIQSVAIGTAAALERSSKCYLLIHGMRTDTQPQRIDCAISSLCAVLTQWKGEMRFNVVMRASPCRLWFSEDRSSCTPGENKLRHQEGVIKSKEGIQPLIIHPETLQSVNFGVFHFWCDTLHTLGSNFEGAIHRSKKRGRSLSRHWPEMIGEVEFHQTFLSIIRIENLLKLQADLLL